jgi:hypothetical protein
MKRFYRIAGTCAVVFWIGMMVLLVGKQQRARVALSFDDHFMGAAVANIEEWAGVYFQGQKIGYTHNSLKRIEDGYQIHHTIRLDMAMMGVAQKTMAQVNTVTDHAFNLQVFSLRINSGAVSFIAYGDVDADNLMSLSVVSGGKTEEKKLQLTRAPVITNALQYSLMKEGLRPGSVYERVVFDPMTMSNRTASIEVQDRETISMAGQDYDCYRMQVTYMGVTMTAWIDQQGRIVKEESPTGMVSLREDREQAMHGGWGERVDMVETAAIEVDTPFYSSNLRSLGLRLLNVELKGFQLDGSWQILQDNVVRIAARDIGKGNSYTLPFAGKGFEAWLAPSLLIQSDREEFVQLVEVIGGNDRRALRLARRLHDWVYKNIEKLPISGMPSALDVLAARQGDCNEHAVLMAALCRAAGIPARVVAGLVYVRGRFYYHAWNELYLNDWVPVDATLNQFPADVTHVRFIEGEMEEQLKVLNLIGRLKIEVVDYK